MNKQKQLEQWAIQEMRLFSLRQKGHETTDEQARNNKRYDGIMRNFKRVATRFV